MYTVSQLSSSPLPPPHSLPAHLQCSKEMQHILRLARRDGDEWVRVLACILAPFPISQSITLEQCPEASLEDTLEEIGNACKFMGVGDVTRGRSR